MLRDIYRQKSFRDLWDIEMVPGEAVNSDAGLWDFARTTGGTVFHCVGTCRMGSDQRSVLDPHLRVRGVDRLRVIDASVMPQITSANTNASEPDDRGEGRGPRPVVTRCEQRADEMDLIADSHVPKYAQIADIFRQRIARGVWAQGLRLPANEVLAAEFGVSRVTIRQAVDLLSRDGVVEAQQGRGTFVTGMLKQDRWLKVETTLSDLAEVYRDTSPEIINISESRTDAPLLPEDGKPAAQICLHAPGPFPQQAALLRDFDLSG